MDTQFAGIKGCGFRAPASGEDVVRRRFVAIAAMMMPDAEDARRRDPSLDLAGVNIQAKQGVFEGVEVDRMGAFHLCWDMFVDPNEAADDEDVGLMPPRPCPAFAFPKRLARVGRKGIHVTRHGVIGVRKLAHRLRVEHDILVIHQRAVFRLTHAQVHFVLVMSGPGDTPSLVAGIEVQADDVFFRNQHDSVPMSRHV